jgi:DNA-binding IclR family transcriptional regulator
MSRVTGSSYKPVVPAVDQAAKVLLCLGENSDVKLTVTQICKKLNIHKSKGYSILHTLMQFDFVTKDSKTKTYELGPGLLSLAKNVQDNFDIRKISEPYLQNLANETKSTVLLGVVSNDQFYITETYEGDDMVGITIRRNQAFHITHGAHGKAITAFMKKSDQEALLKQDNLQFYGENKSFDMNLLNRELKECLDKGYAIDYGMVTQGINALSSPVFNHENNVFAGIVLVGTFPETCFKQYGDQVFTISKQISKKCGANI